MDLSSSHLLLFKWLEPPVYKDDDPPDEGEEERRHHVEEVVNEPKVLPQDLGLGPRLLGVPMKKEIIIL